MCADHPLLGLLSIRNDTAAYVFEESGGAWGLTQTLNAPTKDYELGTAVAVCGDRVYGGAPGAKIGNQGGHGAVRLPPFFTDACGLPESVVQVWLGH